jgi:hypothetical protein
MFDPDYTGDDPLSPEDAIRAMLDGETLYDKEGDKYYWKGKGHALYRRPPKRKRLMARWEVLAWACSEESRGWVVRAKGSKWWCPPQFFSYDMDAKRYERARILPDMSGIDRSTIQGFEVEE